MNTNARSLKPKMDSLIENIKELQADLTIVTETWMRDKDTQEAAQDLSLGARLGLLVRNRPPRDNGVTYGGWQSYGRRVRACSRK